MRKPVETGGPPKRSVLMAWGAVVLGGAFLWGCLSYDNVLDLPVLGSLSRLLAPFAGGSLLHESWPSLLIVFVGVLFVGPLIWGTLPSKTRRIAKHLAGGAVLLALVCWGFAVLTMVDSRLALLLFLLLVGGGFALLRQREKSRGGLLLRESLRALWTVVHRELRVQSRHPSTHLGRVGGVLLVLTCAGFMLMDRDLTHGTGARVFKFLHLVVFYTAGLIMPLITAQCISQERREGTLDLLLVASLRPWQIALAKWSAHMLRGAAFYLAVTPVVAVPILAGGVSWQDVTGSVAVTMAVIGWGLAAGVLASSIARGAIESTLIALLYGGFSLLPFSLVCGFGWMSGLAMFNVPIGYASYMDRFSATSHLGFLVMDGSISRLGLAPQQATAFIAGTAGMLILCLACIAGLIGVAGLLIAQRLQVHLPGRDRPAQLQWGDKRTAARASFWNEEFRTPPVGLALWRSWRQRLLRRDPVGWLGRRDSAGCAISWILFGLLLFLVALDVFTDFDIRMMLPGLAWATIVAFILVAAAAFRGERQTGTMELILITPLRERRMLHGFLRGQWALSRPGAVLLWGCWFWHIARTGFEEGDRSIFYLLLTLAATPVIGLYASLRFRHYLLALATTLLGAVILPLGLGLLVWGMRYELILPELWGGAIRRLGSDETAFLAQACSLLGLLLVTGWSYRRLQRLLVNRSFAQADT